MRTNRAFDPVAPGTLDTPRIEDWLASAALRVSSRRLTPDEIARLCRFWEGAYWRDDALGPGSTRRVKLTAQQRARLKDLVRRAVVAHDGRIALGHVDLVADGDGLRVVLPTRGDTP